MNNTARTLNGRLERAALETLAYFDVFDYPVRLDELYRYLHGIRTSRPELQDALHSLAASSQIEMHAGYHALAGRGTLIERYEAATRENARRLHLAIQDGRRLARLPFIRMVAVTGSVAMQNGGAAADFDYLVVTEPGRLWLGRLFAVALGRWSQRFGHTLCPNIVLSEQALTWQNRDLYSAHELIQMIPVSGLSTYHRLLDLNSWTQLYLPNAHGAPNPLPEDDTWPQVLQALLEQILRTPAGSALERIEMQRKIAKLRRQPGLGYETVFNRDVCQGNFQNHGNRVRRDFEGRLGRLGLEPMIARAPWIPPQMAAGAPLTRSGYSPTRSPTLFQAHPREISAGQDE